MLSINDKPIFASEEMRRRAPWWLSAPIAVTLAGLLWLAIVVGVVEIAG